VSYVSSTELRAQIGAASAGSYMVYLISGDGSVAIVVNGITYSATPTWVTGSALQTAIQGISYNLQLSATSNSAVTYTLAGGSVLPSGLTLTSGGLLSGTLPLISVDTVYNFSILAIDLENQDSPRTFSITITVGETYFKHNNLLISTTSVSGQGNKIFLDSSSNGFTVTPAGNPQQGSVSPYRDQGYSSVYFGGVSDWLTVGQATDDPLGTGNFTMEAWIFNTLSGIANKCVLGKWSSGAGWVLWESGGVVLFTTSFGVTLTSSASFPVNLWSHVAVTRVTATWTLYLNGVSIASTNFSGSLNNTNIALQVGSFESGNSPWQGLISNVHIIKGTALYSGASYSPPAAVITAQTGTSVLTCQDSIFKDNSGTGLLVVPSGAPSTLPYAPPSPGLYYNPAIHGGSAYFIGVTDNLTVLDNVALQFGTGDFTIECWFYIVGVTTTAFNLVSKGTATTGWSLNTTTTGRIQFSYTAANLTGATTTLTSGLWYHVAVIRSSTSTGNLRIYLNGVLEIASAGAVNDNFNQTNTLYIAASRTNTLPLNGYIANLRLVKGVPVYTGAFSPPTLSILATSGASSAASYTNITNVNTSFVDSSTSLLLNFANATVYDSTMVNNIATVATAQSNNTNYKFLPTSVRFAGTTDWLTCIDRIPHRFGANNFTIECWFLSTVASAAYNLISKGTATTGWSLNVTAANRIQFSYTAANLTGATTTLTNNVWYHVAVVRNGSAAGNVKIYLNGALEISSAGAVVDAFTQNNILYIGASRTGTVPINGYIQDVRLTNGIARYTSPFAVATALSGIR
jgi:hypothetical protein